MLSRSDQSDIFLKIANEPKLSINQELQQLFAGQTVMPLSTAREARRVGFLKRASEDLYESAETKDYWKINKVNGTIERVVEINDQGIIKE